MAVLSWKEVQGPDFRGVTDGYEAANRMLMGALGSAKGVVGDVQQAKEDNTSNALLARLSQYQDHNQLQTDLASGSLQGQFDTRYLSPEAMKALNQRPTDLLKLAADKSAYNETQKNIADRDHFRNNREVFNPYFDMIRQGRRQEAIAFAEANAPIFEQANTVMMQELINSGENIYGDGVRNDQNATDLFQDQTLFGRDTESYEVGLAANALEGQLLKLMPGDRLRFVNNNRAALDERFGSRAVDRILGQLDKNFVAPNAGGTGGAGGAGLNLSTIVGAPDDASAIVEGAKQLGIDPTDLATIISYETGGKFDPSIRGGKNNRHIGLIQFGDNEQQTYGAAQGQTIPQQMGAVVKYLKDRGVRPGDDITTLYKIINGGNRNASINASDGNGTIGSHVENMLAQHRDNATRFLGVANPRSAEVAIQTNVQRNLAGNPGTNLVRLLNDAWNDTRDAGTIANELTKEGGRFAGESAPDLTRLIKRIADDNGLNEAVAAVILQRAHTGRQGVLGRMFTNFWGNDGLEIDYNSDQIKRDVELAKDRKALTRQAVSMDAQLQSVAAAQQANGAVKALERAQAQNRLEALASGRIYDSTIDDLLVQQARGQQAAALETGARAAIEGNPTPPDHAPTGNPTGSTTPVGAQVHPAVRQAQAISRLNGVIRERQAARFEQTYGMSPEEAMANPGALPAVGRSVTTRLPGGTPTRDELRAAATRAIAGGAATIRAFQQLYGHHPRHFR